jgi:FlaA1/EpsC-like NDP-sugar epimerase
MKKSTLLCGVVSCFLLLIGVHMKFMHWAGAGVVITLSIALFALGYAVLLLLDKNKLAQNSYQKFVNIMSLVTMIVVAASFLFKVQHWPGAGLLIYFAHAFLFVMIPVLFAQGSKESDPVRKLNINNTAIILTLITAVSIYLWWRTAAMHP